MSLYNLVNGFNISCLYFLPMLGLHPDEYPRFRDCFIDDESLDDSDTTLKEWTPTSRIIIFTRTGGGNREAYEEQNAAIQNIPGFIRDEDDDFDSTFAHWYFEVPERWRRDFDSLVKGNGLATSAYREEMKRVFPKLTEQINTLPVSENV